MIPALGCHVVVELIVTVEEFSEILYPVSFSGLKHGDALKVLTFNVVSRLLKPKGQIIVVLATDNELLVVTTRSVYVCDISVVNKLAAHE